MVTIYFCTVSFASVHPTGVPLHKFKARFTHLHLHFYVFLCAFFEHFFMHFSFIFLRSHAFLVRYRSLWGQKLNTWQCWYKWAPYQKMEILLLGMNHSLGNAG